MNPTNVPREYFHQRKYCANNKQIGEYNIETPTAYILNREGELIRTYSKMDGWEKIISTFEEWKKSVSNTEKHCFPVLPQIDYNPNHINIIPVFKIKK